MAKEAIHGPHVHVHREGNGTCGKWLYFDSDLWYETQDVAVIDAAYRLSSGRFRPEDLLPVSLAPQAPERPLSSFHGKASLYNPRFFPTLSLSPTIQLCPLA